MLDQYQKIGEKDTRSGFGDAMTELGQENPNVVALCADLTSSLKLGEFKKQNPESFIQAGIAEANMIGVAAGLTIGGKIPFACTFANFATGRVYDQIRQSVAYSGKNVKICASHAGLTLGEDGATHQILEDIGLMRMLPGMVVINPADYNQTKQATKAIAKWNGPCYLRFGRPKWPIFMPKNQSFEIGKAICLKPGNDISIFATGHMLWQAIEATKALEMQGVSVELINIHTIKPLDEEAILNSVRKTGKAVVAEEHQKAGGLASAISEFLIQSEPVPMKFVGVNDSFGESGKPLQLLEKYGLSPNDIKEAVDRLL